MYPAAACVNPALFLIPGRFLLRMRVAESSLSLARDLLFMRRYSQAFLAVALFCFLFPFVVITPAKNSGAFQMTGWEMLTTQNIGVSKQPPMVLHIPMRTPVLLALLCGAAGILVKLAKRKDIGWLGAAVTIVSAVSMCTVMSSSLPVQLTDGQNVLYEFANPPVQLLPAFYVALGLMAAAVVSSFLNLAKQPSPATMPVLVRASVAPAASLPVARPSSFCTKCGGGLNAGARFCNRCGSVVPAAATVSRPVAPAVASQVAATTVPAVSTPTFAAGAAASSAAITNPTSPSFAPVAAPAQVAFRPQPGTHTSAHTGLSAGAKLGFAAAALIFAVAIWFAARPSSNHSASMNPTTVSISPAVIRVVPGGTVRVMALVNGDDRDVQWTIAEGNSGGSIEAGGATMQNGTVFLLGNYHAPYAPGVYHVIAVSAADQTRRATAQVIVSY